MQRFFDVIQDRLGNAIPGAYITVYDSNGSQATLYSDNGVTEIPNPVTTNIDGEYAFYAANGVYSIHIVAAGFIDETRTGIMLYDPIDGGFGLLIDSLDDLNDVTIDYNNIYPQSSLIWNAISQQWENQLIDAFDVTYTPGDVTNWWSNTDPGNIDDALDQISNRITLIETNEGLGLTDGDKGDITVSNTTTVWTIDNSAVTYAKMQNVSETKRVLGRKTAGAGVVEELTASEVMDFVGTAAQGDLLYRDAAGWALLPAGTSGYYLMTQGAAANPMWDAGPGGQTLLDLITLLESAEQGDMIIRGATAWELFSPNAAGDMIIAGVNGWEILPKGAESEALMVVPTAFGGSGLPEWSRVPAAPECWCITCSDETTAITADTGVPKRTFLTPYAFQLEEIKGSLTVPQTSGSRFTVNVKVAGTTIFSTKLTFDNGEQGTFSSSVPYVLTTDPTVFAGNAKVEIFVDQIGDGTAAGLNVYFVGRFVLGV